MEHVMDSVENLILKIHIDHYVAQEAGVGYYYAIHPSTELYGPFGTSDAAKDAAIEVITQSVAEAAIHALFGE
ncbi:hypothetical protein B7L88_gp164 [Rhizobium phage RHEph10]|uniref:hypothetical protein n=1 Tax=Rhizobium phage RHEph10 TaxID=1220717 RepID=UPI0002AB1F2B|nr:hypothetical protein B7L88_gp164 [Rhizobium phage RHEph10]AGC36124.1 hypothetical protein RHEph10_gp081 [Rhizobium phage RHEph10]